MALIGRTQIGLRDTTTSATIPDNAKARLMYYLNCVATVLEISDEVPRRLTDYTNYNRLSDDELADLLAHCMVLSPDVLEGKCFIEDSSQTSNRFLELSATQSSMLVAGGLMIAGQNRRVANIMTYPRAWMVRNYIDPIAEILAEQLVAGALRNTRPAITAAAAPAAATRNTPSQQSSDSDCCCTIL